MTAGTKVLITGASGLLGKYLMMTAPSHVHMVGTWFTHMMTDGYRLDIADEQSVQSFMDRERPDTVIHCAAIGSVDYCESNPNQAQVVNVLGTKHVVDASKHIGAKFVYISTNAVFDGTHPPYVERSIRASVNEYGKSKIQAEDIVIERSIPNWMIIRPIMLYGVPHPGGRGNWVTRTVAFLSSGKELRVVSDVMTQPTYAMDCAQTIWGLLSLNRHGVWHVGGANIMPFDVYIRDICRIWGLDQELIQCIRSSDLAEIAPRPKDTTYNLVKLYDLDIQSLRPSGTIHGLRRMWHEH